jgi:hypothetical protein
MSTTIHISNDSDQSITESYECCENKHCPFCKGSGTYSYKLSKWQLNMSQVSFETVWSSLGFVPNPSGTIFPHALISALKSFNKELAITSSSVDNIGLGGRFIGCGITEQRIDRYVEKLNEIALEALKREERILWD